MKNASRMLLAAIILALASSGAMSEITNLRTVLSYPPLDIFITMFKFEHGELTSIHPQPATTLFPIEWVGTLRNRK